MREGRVALSSHRMFLEGYAVLESIAQTEHNSVFRARRARDGARVIIKTSTAAYPTPRELRRLELELHLLKKLRSPSVIEVLDVERRNGRVALILEDFGGERLPITRERGLALERFFPLAAGIVRALGGVHAKGVIHKDINPRNVLVNLRSGAVKLIDFSLSSELSHEHPDAVPCKDLEGTLPYLSPEQTGRTNRDLDFRTDYYSLGVTFYELLTGGLPFSAPDVLGYVHCHLSQKPPSAREKNPEVPEALARIVAKLLAKNPDDRYESTRGLASDLERAERLFKTGAVTQTFELGTDDVSERFRVSRELVGREPEIARLLAAFESASNGASRLVLVSGYSGVGKTSLVREIHRPVIEKRGAFASGKFAELERNKPYGAVVTALRSLLKQVLSGTEEQLFARRQRLETALAGEGAALLPLLPELARILGPQPLLAELPARETQARLLRVFRRLVGALGTRNEPLVLFLDDLQWTDGSTPQLLLELFTDDELRHVLVLGAYRDNEVGDNHLLRAALSELERVRPTALDEIRLTPLGPDAIERIVACTLRSSAERCRPLARLVAEKAGGNPFFTAEILHRLHRRGFIRFEPEAREFRFEAAALPSLAFSDNVVELLVERMKELPEEALELIRVGACIGRELELALLARVAGKSERHVAEVLFRAVELRLLAPKGDEYRFLRAGPDASDGAAPGARYEFAHDRVLAAAYSLVTPEERARTHLAVGRLLRDAVPLAERDERVFEFVDHMNLGRTLIAAFEERDELARSNQLAAERARRSAAYPTAVAYLETSAGLLAPEEWAADAARRFELARLRVECVFLAGQVERASGLVEELFARAPDRVTAAAAYCLKARIQEHQSRLADSVATILAGLASLGVELPAEPLALEQGIGAGIGKLVAHLERVPIEALEHLPALADPTQHAVTELLFQLIPPASQMNPPLFILAELLLFDLALTHGTVPGSAKNFMDCGIVLGAILKDYGRAYRMGKVAFALLERQIPTPLESAVNFVFGCFISHFGAHFHEGLEALERGHRRGVELGDTLHASYSIVHHAKSTLFAGKPLVECRAAAELALAYTRATGAVGHEAVPRMLLRALDRLQAPEHAGPDATLSDAEFGQEIEKTGNDHFVFVARQLDTLVHALLGSWDAAEAANEAVAARLEVGNGSFPVPDFHLFAALIACKRARRAPEPERAELLRRGEEHAATLATFAAACPANFAHKLKLARAELARLAGAPVDEVLCLYAEALAMAGDDFTHLRALVFELEAEFWSEQGRLERARDCLLECHRLYRQWGAREKLASLERTHADVFGRPRAAKSERATAVDTVVTATVTTGVEGSSLDGAAALKATHAVAAEIEAERLFAALVQSALESTGAERAYLVVPSGAAGELTVVAGAPSGEVPSTPAFPVALEAFDGITRELVRYVARTQETVALDDARSDERYAADLHVARTGMLSVLCMPIASGGALHAVLYLENAALTGVFTAARLSLARVIATQGAISFVNVARHAELAARLAERTHELADQHRTLAAVLNGVEEGVFTIGRDLAIEPRYSAHLERLLGTRDLAGRDCLEVLFGNASVEPFAVDDMRRALGQCFGASPLLVEAQRPHWVREFRRGAQGELQCFELTVVPITDGTDRVSRMLIALRDVTLLEELGARAALLARDAELVMRPPSARGLYDSWPPGTG
jgi:histidine kinase